MTIIIFLHKTKRNVLPVFEVSLSSSFPCERLNRKRPHSRKTTARPRFLQILKYLGDWSCQKGSEDLEKVVIFRFFSKSHASTFAALNKAELETRPKFSLFFSFPDLGKCPGTSQHCHHYYHLCSFFS